MDYIADAAVVAARDWDTEMFNLPPGHDLWRNQV